jgi:hypothetical protein
MIIVRRRGLVYLQPDIRHGTSILIQPNIQRHREHDRRIIVEKHKRLEPK